MLLFYSIAQKLLNIFDLYLGIHDHVTSLTPFTTMKSCCSGVSELVISLSTKVMA